jgi:hypothetical protein
MTPSNKSGLASSNATKRTIALDAGSESKGCLPQFTTTLIYVASDCYIKKIQDSTGADIDMRDTVQDILGEFPPAERIIHVQQLLHGRDDTVPFDSYLHPPKLAPTTQERETINRQRIELDRYGTTLDNLNPDHPVTSHERPAETRKDKDGFAIPARINRPQRTHVARDSPVISSSQLFSQDSYEDQLVHSPELGSPQKAFKAVQRLETPPDAANKASQYSTLDAVPSAQKPPTAFGNRRLSVEVQAASEDALELADPISEDSQPRLSSSISQTPAGSSRTNKRKSLDSSEVREINAQKLSNLWTDDEKDVVIEGLVKGLNPAEMKLNLPNRSVDSIRKKAASLQKLNPLAVQERKASLTDHWTEDQDAHFIRAIRENKTWKTLRDHRFRDRSGDSVKYHYVEIRKRLEKEAAATSARVLYQEQSKKGTPSTGPNEKFTQEDDDFLLACRVENVEMKRVAKEHFPLRAQEQVTNRAGNLFHNAKRAADKANPLDLGRSPSVEFLFAHDLEVRERMEPHLEKAREFKKKSSNDRARETEESSRRKSMLNSDNRRTEERREREEKSNKVVEALEEAQKEGEQVKRRRLNDDIKRGVLSTTTQTPRPASSTRNIAAEDSKPRSSTTPLAGQGTKKRRTSTVEVQVVIPSSKKQKTAATAEATPQVKKSNLKAASASKIPPLSTPNRGAPQVVPQSAMARLGRTAQPQKTGALSGPARERPSVTFASLSATQPVGSNVLKKTTQENAIRNVSSPGVSAKSLRQSKLPFQHNGQQLPKSSARKSTPASARKSSTASITPRKHTTVSDSIFISSDEESSYDDKDITDEELNAVAERSEAMYSSSPVKSPQKQHGLRKHLRDLVSPGANALRSSPPVASMPTPKGKALLGSAALKSAVKTELSFSSTMPSVPISELSPSTNRKSQKKPDTSTEHDLLTEMQGDKLPTFETSTAEDAASDHEEDALVMEEDQFQHATHSTPVFPSLSPEAGALDNTITAIASQDADVDTSPVSDISRQPTTEETGAVSSATKLEKRNHNNVSKNKEEDPPNADSDTDDVEAIDCYRSDSSDVHQEADWPSAPSDAEVPPRKPLSESFGPLVTSDTERTPNKSATDQPGSQLHSTAVELPTAVEEKSISEQVMNIITSLPARTEKVASTAPVAGKTPPSTPFQPKDFQDGPFTSPMTRPLEESSEHAAASKKARRSQGRRKGSRILDDVESFIPPPSSPLPDLLKGGGLRKKAKQPVEKNHEITAAGSDGTSLLELDSTTPSTARAEATSKQPATQLKSKRKSPSFEDTVKNMLEKGQALGSQSQAPAASKKRKTKPPASTQPVKKADLVPNHKKTVSSQPVSNSNAGRVINPHAFDWDNAQDSAELIRQADQRMRDAANMDPEDFWQQSNLNNMNEEQILSHMIEQGVKRSMERRQREKDNNIAGRVDDSAAMLPATQPVQRSVNAFNDWTPRPATQPVMQTSHQDSDDSSSSEDDDSEEETLEQSLETLAKQAEASRKEKRGVNALPYW